MKHPIHHRETLLETPSQTQNVCHADRIRPPETLEGAYVPTKVEEEAASHVHSFHRPGNVHDLSLGVLRRATAALLSRNVVLLPTELHMIANLEAPNKILYVVS